MELRKRTRAAAAKTVEDNYVDVSTPSPRKTRKTRAPAQPNFSPAENDSTQGEQAESDINIHKAAGLEAKISIDGCRPVDEANRRISQKDEENGEPVAKEHDAVKQTQDDGNSSKKRRKVNTESEIPEVKSTFSVVVTTKKEPQSQEAGALSEASVKRKVHANESENTESDLLGISSTENPSDQLHSSFMSGVELPIQPHNKKDVHIGPRTGIEPDPLISEATSKRRRSSNEETNLGDTNSINESPRKRGRRKKINEGASSKVERVEMKVCEMSSSQSRKRAPRVSYNEDSDGEGGNELAFIPQKDVSPPPKASPKRKKNIKVETSTTLEQPKGRKGRKGIWDKEVLLTSKKSKLATAEDLSDIFNATTWELLTLEEKKECLALLPTIDKVYASPDLTDPSADPNGEPLLAPEFFECNQVFKDSLIEFQDDLSQGRYQPSYITDAANARRARLQGEVDNYKDGQYELFWGQRQYNGMVAGAAAAIRLPELVQRGLLRQGDVWAYKRTMFGITIEKEVKVAEIIKEDKKTSLVFHIPPDKHKFSHPSRSDIVLAGVVSPTAVESVILKTHPNTPATIPNGNAFKVFNIWRKGEDLGLLWEIRQTYWGGE